jgi:hypothetical protein
MAPTVRAEAELKRKRPFGVRMIAFLLAIEGLAALPAVDLTVNIGNGAGVAARLDIGLAVLGLAGLVVAVGLWRLQYWAWVGAMLLVGVELVTVLAAYLDGHPRYLPMVLNVVCVFYLNQRTVQQVFRSHPGRQPEPV